MNQKERELVETMIKETRHALNRNKGDMVRRVELQAKLDILKELRHRLQGV